MVRGPFDMPAQETIALRQVHSPSLGVAPLKTGAAHSVKHADGALLVDSASVEMRQ